MDIETENKAMLLTLIASKHAKNKAFTEYYENIVKNHGGVPPDKETFDKVLELHKDYVLAETYFNTAISIAKDLGGM